MKELIENYINGNLTTAKQQARRFRESTILAALHREYGYSLDASLAIAAYLKGNGTFQAACDAERSDCNSECLRDGSLRPSELGNLFGT